MKLPHLPAGTLAVTQNFEKLSVLLPTGVVTSLPSAPVDEQEINYVADAANGIIWRFRYRAASTSTHKWEFVGGPPVEGGNSLNTAFTTKASLEIVTLTGASYTIPLAGDYRFGGVAEVIQQSAGTPEGQVQIAKNGAVVGNVILFASGVQFGRHFGPYKAHIVGFAAGDVVTLKGEQVGAGELTFQFAGITEVVPQRVG